MERGVFVDMFCNSVYIGRGEDEKVDRLYIVYFEGEADRKLVQQTAESLISGLGQANTRVVFGSLRQLSPEGVEALKNDLLAFSFHNFVLTFPKLRKNVSRQIVINHALSLFKSKSVVLLRAGVIVFNGFSELVTKSLEKFHAVGPVFSTTHSGWQGSRFLHSHFGGFPEESCDAERHREFAQRVRAEAKSAERVEAGLSLFCCAFRREVFDKFGGLDERFTSGVLEHLELFDRISQEFSFAINPSLYVLRLDGLSANKASAAIEAEEMKVLELVRRARKLGHEGYIIPLRPGIEKEMSAEHISGARAVEPKGASYLVMPTEQLPRGKDSKHIDSALTVLVCTRNRARNLALSLYSIMSQNPDVKARQIVIVDSESTDGTDKVVEFFSNNKLGWPIKFIHHHPSSEFLNPGVAHNIGLVYSDGDLVIQSGSDSFHVGNTLESLLNSFVDNPRLISAQVRRITEDRIAAIPLRVAGDVSGYIMKNSEPYAIRMDPDEVKSNATPFCTIYRKEWTQQIGLYDEDFDMGGGEDCDFIYRMQREADTRWHPTATVCHLDHPKFSGMARFDLGYKQNCARLKVSIAGGENRRRLKILMLGSFNLAPFSGFLLDALQQSFQRLGHRVSTFDPLPLSLTPEDFQANARKVIPAWGRCDTDLLMAVESTKPDLILSLLPVSHRALARVKSSMQHGSSLFVAGWQGDMRRPESFSEFRGLFDCLFITNSGQCSDYAAVCGCPVFPSSFGVVSTAHYVRSCTKKYDVGFAGTVFLNHTTDGSLPEAHKLNTPPESWSEERNRLLKELSVRSDLSVKTVNNLWDKTWDFYSECRIVIASGSDAGRSVFGYTSNRLFNIVGCGAFGLVQKFSGLDLLGVDGEHFVSYSSNEEAVRKIDYYLQHSEERERIASQGYRYFHFVHDWMNKARYMSDVVCSLMDRRA